MTLLMYDFMGKKTFDLLLFVVKGFQLKHGSEKRNRVAISDVVSEHIPK